MASLTNTEQTGKYCLSFPDFSSTTACGHYLDSYIKTFVIWILSYLTYLKHLRTDRFTLPWHLLWDHRRSPQEAAPLDYQAAPCLHPCQRQADLRNQKNLQHQMVKNIS